MNRAKYEVITINAQHPIVIKGFMEICFCEDNMRSLYKTYLRMGICLNMRKHIGNLLSRQHIQISRNDATTQRINSRFWIVDFGI